MADVHRRLWESVYGDYTGSLSYEVAPASPFSPKEASAFEKGSDGTPKEGSSRILISPTLTGSGKAKSGSASHDDVIDKAFYRPGGL